MNPRIAQKKREATTALPLYYAGQLLKKCPKDKDFKRYYGELRGATLFFYTDDTLDTYTERLELEQLKTMELDSPYKVKTPAIFTLTLPDEDVQLKMDNPDTGEEWRGFILTVVNKQIPGDLKMLPGQRMQLEEALNVERRRNPTHPRLPPRPAFMCTSASPPLPSKDKPDSSTADMPACFFHVNRQEAERMLTESPENGSIILRPSTLAKNYAVTLRQQTSSGPVMKNYRVSSTKSGFVIELETPVTVSTLENVIKYFLEKTEHRLYPYTSQSYDTRIVASPAPKSMSGPLPGSKTVPKAEVAPLLRAQPKEEPEPPAAEAEENDYVVPDEHRHDDHKERHDSLGSELRAVLKIRRQNIYAESDTFNSEKSHPSKVHW